VAADVAGYSRLMGLDEVGTARILREHRKVTDALVAKHGGPIDRARIPKNPDSTPREALNRDSTPQLSRMRSDGLRESIAHNLLSGSHGPWQRARLAPRLGHFAQYFAARGRFQSVGSLLAAAFDRRNAHGVDPSCADSLVRASAQRQGLHVAPEVGGADNINDCVSARPPFHSQRI